MWATQIDHPGGPEALTLREVADPTAPRGHVVVRVAYSGVTFADTKFRRGEVDCAFPFTPGLEVTGHVEAVGEGVTGLSIGTPVAALSIVDFGGYAELVTVDQHLVVPLPDDSDENLQRVCGAPVNTTAAIVALAATDVPSRVLVHGANSGVGIQFGQAARLLGAQEVVGTVRTMSKTGSGAASHFDSVLSDREWLAEPSSADQWELIVDPVGGSIRQSSFQRLASGGTLVLVGNASREDDVVFSAAELFRTSRTVSGFSLGALATRDPHAVRPALERAIRWAASGRIDTHVEAVHDHTDVVELHTAMDAGTATGKHLLRWR